MMKKSVLAGLALLSSVGLLGTVQEASAWRAAGCGAHGCGAAWGGAWRSPGHYYGPGRYYGPVPRGGGVVVVNPRPYWPPGGAVAAGAALGFLTGVAAANLVGPPPQPNYCWFYTNPQRTQGFWEPCP